MANFVQVVNDQGSILFETEHVNSSTFEELGASDSLSDAIAEYQVDANQIAMVISTVTRSITDGIPNTPAIRETGGKIEQIDVEFGVNVSAEGSVFVARAGTEVNLSVTVTWKFTT